MKENIQNKGITLIALVVTLVVLLILAGVTINLILGDSGIFNQAQSLQQKQEEAMLKEKLELIRLNLEAEKAINGSITIEDFFEDLKEEGLISDTEIGGDNIKEIEPDKEGNHRYEITTDDGHVIEVEIDEEGNIEIEYQGKADGLPPRIREIVTNSTANSIHITVDVTRLEGGSLSYYYKKNGEEESSYQAWREETTETTVDITGLEQNIVYNIKVVASNSNGSVEEVVNQQTGELAEGTINQVGNIEWNNGTATLKLETNEAGVDIVYQKGNIDGEWIPYPEGGITGLNHGDMIYAAISDGTNVSKESYFEIQDGIAPTVNITQGTITTRSIVVSVSAVDREWGMIESPNYNYYIKKSTDSSYPSTASYTGTNTSYTFDNLSQTTSYDIRITTVDKAGNEGSKEITGINTGTVSGATGGLIEGNIIASNPTWSNNTASITLSKGSGVASNLNIEWQINGIEEGSWTTGTSVTELSYNDTVYARLTDGINAGNYASVIISDGIAPSAPTISISSGTPGNNGYYKSNVTVTITAGSDAQSGANQVRYSVSGAQTVSQTTTAAGTTSASITISTDGTSTITAYTIDRAGNVSGARTQTINKDSTAPSTASLTVGTVGETSIAVTARGADSTSGIYSYQFQRSTTSSTSGFTTVATQTSTATSYSYTYTGLTAGTTYYLRIIVTDRAGNTRTSSVVTQTTASRIENTLKAGDHVYYYDKNNTRRLCVVLYDNNSEYGVQIITADTVGTITLNGRDDYNDAISKLNSAAGDYLNTTYASDARCVGSVPNNKNSQARTSSYFGVTMRNSDNNYTTDYNQMETLGIEDIGKHYWLASRIVLDQRSSADRYSFIVRSVRYDAGVDYNGDICCVESDGNVRDLWWSKL